ncbi:membrane dipeptidase, partial [Phenoliferia sp. Uapishka_3]
MGRPEESFRPSPTVEEYDHTRSKGRRFKIALVALFALGILSQHGDGISDALAWARNTFTPLPSDPLLRAHALLRRSPLIGKHHAMSELRVPTHVILGPIRIYSLTDGHLDVPILAREAFRNQISEIDLEKPTRGQIDIPRLRAGGVGGMMWSVYVPCPEDAGYPKDNDGNFTTSTWRTRDTLEQIDIAHLLIAKHSDTFEYTPTAKSWKKAMRKGKIGGMLGVEGGHQLGNSLSSLRTYYALGARYLTLTHTCHNALADSCGYQGAPLKPRWGGLSSFGKTAVKEMNRLGMMLDLSHTDPSTASDALTLSLSPPIFSHSNARGVHAAVRNVPDSILRRIGATSNRSHCHRKHLADASSALDGEGGLGWGNDTDEATKPVPSGRQKLFIQLLLRASSLFITTLGDSLIMLNFSPGFVSEWDDGSPGGVRANVSSVADHADYIGRLAGREHVGIGSDFDGIANVPEGLEDASKYPALIAELITRGWSDLEIKGLTGGNFLRIIEKVERVAHKLRHALPETEIFEGRTDMQKHEWW